MHLFFYPDGNLSFCKVILRGSSMSNMSVTDNFDSSKAYAQQEQVYFNDGREAQLLRHILSRPDINTLRGSPQNVLAAIDNFGRQKKYLMNVGEDKGGIVTKLIHKTYPRLMVSYKFLPKVGL